MKFRARVESPQPLQGQPPSSSWSAARPDRLGDLRDGRDL
jgi:hypothetical protein